MLRETPRPRLRGESELPTHPARVDGRTDQDEERLRAGGYACGPIHEVVSNSYRWEEKASTTCKVCLVILEDAESLGVHHRLGIH